MRQIPLSRGRVAIVDDIDYERVSQHKWCLNRTVSGLEYAVRFTSRTKPPRTAILMHREVLRAATYDSCRMGIDHINGDGLDNRRSNLRLVTPAINMLNYHRRRPNRRGFPMGVWAVSRLRFGARLGQGRKCRYLGAFDTPELAHAAYMAARDRAIREALGHCPRYEKETPNG